MSQNKTQYEQLSKDVRHYDTQLYVIPTTLLVILGTALKFAVERSDDLIKIGIIGFVVFVCHTFTILFAKLSIHQRGVRAALSCIERSDSSYVKVGRATWGSRDIEKITRSDYAKNTPLWRYFFTSADKTIMRMMMISVFGTTVYFVKTVLDFLKILNGDYNIYLSVVLSVVAFFVYMKIISHKSKQIDSD